jgi:isopentenyl diphosphate isomerase/L-lactate dehydrogenase-like FMN-dependent dehydrogenase
MLTDRPAVDLGRVHALREFEALAAPLVDPGGWDYIAGGAWDEQSLAENDAAWRRRRLRPRVLVDVSRIDPSATLLGAPAAFPVATAPMAAHGIAHPDAEIATARAAAAAGIPFTLSTMSTRSIEEVAAAAPDATRWFQLYTQAESGKSRSLVERAATTGYAAIVLTVDLPVIGYRERDRRTAYDLPLPLGNFEAPLDRPSHAGHADHDDRDGAGSEQSLADRLDRSLTWDDLAEIQSWSDLPLVLKGIMTPEDASLAADHGVAGIIVSNHGARQLDRVAAPVDVLEEIAAAVGGRCEIWVDGGVRRGLDVAIAIALGARGVLLGRPILWALAAGGQPGVERALAILREEFETALALLGAPTPAAIRRDHVAP